MDLAVWDQDTIKLQTQPNKLRKEERKKEKKNSKEKVSGKLTDLSFTPSHLEQK